MSEQINEILTEIRESYHALTSHVQAVAGLADLFKAAPGQPAPQDIEMLAEEAGKIIEILRRVELLDQLQTALDAKDRRSVAAFEGLSIRVSALEADIDTKDYQLDNLRRENTRQANLVSSYVNAVTQANERANHWQQDAAKWREAVAGLGLIEQPGDNPPENG